MISSSVFLFRFFIVIAVILSIDFYLFSGIKAAIPITLLKSRRIIYWIYWSVNIAFVLGAFYAALSFSHSKPPGGLFPILAGAFVLLMVPKLILTSFLLTEDLYRIMRGMIVSIQSVFISSSDSTSFPSWVGRRKFISQMGIVVASIPFASIIYGIVKGKYNYKIHRVNIPFKDLPEEFDGFTITQVSDIHAGSFDDMDAVKRGIELIKEQKSDTIIFTGDLVNNFAHEMEPWVEAFSQLKAPYGKYSITGNHDYGDYVQWDSEDKKTENFNALKQVHHQMGFRLLLNENIYLEKETKRIALLGIENWGGGGFSKYGDLEKTMRGIHKDEFKILLSHDPSHWDKEVLNHEHHHIHLTLSGHTHGMQFGIEIPGIKWSPVKYRYPHWAGLYEQGGKHIYVNRGFGFLGFPGRVGIWPEITVITLQKA